jgi:hypothetical protein
VSVSHPARPSWHADLHLRLARRYAVDRRATRAAAASLAAAVLAWPLGLGPGLHALVILGAAALAGLAPVPAPIGRAFAWIGREAGLAYQTHVEYAGRDDPYGFLGAGAVQARLSVRGVAPPPRSAWWLPLAATAIGVWLVSLLVGGWPGFGGAPAATPGAGPVPPTPPPLTAPPEPEGIDEVEEPPTPPVDEPTPSSPLGQPGTPDHDADDEAVAELSERELLDRFLDNLRDRGDVTDVADFEPDEVRDGLREDQLPTGRLEESPPDDPDREGTLRPGERPDDGEPSDARREPAAPDEVGDDAQQGDDDPMGDGRPIDEEGEEGEPDAGEAPPEGEDPSELGEPGEGQGQAGGDDAMPDAGEGEDAGFGRGAEADPSDVEVVPQAEPEALPGMILPGTETPGGRVRLPGRHDGHVPEGASVEGYERAVEQAITDGAVPAAYQEVIRNYFR